MSETCFKRCWMSPLAVGITCLLVLPVLLVRDAGAAGVGATVFPNIFGNDHRVMMERREVPLSAIGYLITPRGHCTATLVAREWALTAAHCVVPRNKRRVELEGVEFVPNVHHGSTTAIASVIDAVVGSTDVEGALANRVHDWAILRLSAPLGDQFGTLAIQPMSAEALMRRGASLGLFGYPDEVEDGGTLVKHTGCSVRGVSPNGVLLHDCDSTPGQSGGPLVDTVTGNIVGVNNAQISPVTQGAGAEAECGPSTRTLRGVEFSDLTTNLAAPVYEALEALRRR